MVLCVASLDVISSDKNNESEINCQNKNVEVGYHLPFYNCDFIAPPGKFYDVIGPLGFFSPGTLSAALIKGLTSYATKLLTCTSI